VVPRVQRSPPTPHVLPAIKCDQRLEWLTQDFAVQLQG
jgi:hypothetical protein